MIARRRLLLQAIARTQREVDETALVLGTIFRGCEFRVQEEKANARRRLSVLRKLL